MIIKTLGILDLFIAVVFWIFGAFGLIPESFILILGIILLIKGTIFFFGLSVTSLLDIFSAIIIIVSTLVQLPFLLIFLVSLFLLQKGFFSLVE